METEVAKEDEKNEDRREDELNLRDISRMVLKKEGENGLLKKSTRWG